jgi:simple sugar transport system ATP-binding protein
MAQTLCKIRGITKAFGENQVLRQLSLDLEEGTVTVLMGANGAGKSTLVKILSGVHQRDAGTIELNGSEFIPTTPAEAIKGGVVTVHQSINDGVIADLDVASNLMIDRLAESNYGWMLKRDHLFKEAQKIADKMDLKIDVRRPVSELGVADRQLIAIARAMSHEPSLMILDEPTSSLSASEAERLFLLIETLKERGVAILYISHRMSDIRRIADMIVSMRDGEISGVFEGENLDYEGAVNAMLGHTMTDVDIDVQSSKNTVVDIKNLQLTENSKPFDLHVGANEVVAISGLLGSGKTALAQILFGMLPVHDGTINLSGYSYKPKSPADAIQSGVFMSSKDRASNSVIADFDIAGNISVPFLKKISVMHFLQRGKERQQSRAAISALDIVCQSETDGINTLSGGNQQKVMLARWLAQDCRLLLLDEPFQGVDIKSRRDIGRKVRQTATDRATIVFVAELDEALEIADRIVVMHDSTIVADFQNKNVDLNQILAAVTGNQTVISESA